jgi:hypothetical protein
MLPFPVAALTLVFALSLWAAVAWLAGPFPNAVQRERSGVYQMKSEKI